MYTNRWMIFAQSLFTDGQGIIQEICCIFVFILVSELERDVINTGDSGMKNRNN